MSHHNHNNLFFRNDGDNFQLKIPLNGQDYYQQQTNISNNYDNTYDSNTNHNKINNRKKKRFSQQINDKYHFHQLNTYDTESFKVCGPSSCIINSRNNCYNSNGESEDMLYPYKRPRKTKEKSWVQLNIYGSAFVAAWRQIIIIYALCVVLSLLIIFEIIPPSIFPFDSFLPGLIFTVYSFLIGIYFSIAYGNRQSALVSYIIEIMGNTIDTGINVSSLIPDRAINKPLWRYKYDGPNVQLMENTNVWCHLKDINYILKSMPYAIKHKYRPEEGLEPGKLPMPSDLISELSIAIDMNMDGLDRMRQMYLSRVSRLIEEGYLPASSVGNLFSKSDNWGTSIGKIDYLLGQAAIPRIFYNLVLLSLWIYCLYLPLALWPYWGLTLSLWVYYPALFFGVTFILSLFNSITTMNNPFKDPEESNFIYLDLGGIANSVAEGIDVSFILVKKELIAISKSELSKSQKMEK
jgi:hypothetical protein